jgi:3-methyladenine DNA glycosylase AlkD
MSTEKEMALKELEASIHALSPEALDHVAAYVEKAKRKNHPMPRWKKKLYLSLAIGIGFWALMHYLHYEACREKFPQASGWVCLISPR